jgi:hypothetical protein
MREVKNGLMSPLLRELADTLEEAQSLNCKAGGNHDE